MYNANTNSANAEYIELCIQLYIAEYIKLFKIEFSEHDLKINMYLEDIYWK